MKSKLDRRKFLAVSGAGSGLLLAGCSSSPEETAEPAAVYQSFSSQDARLLSALGQAILAPQGEAPSLRQVNLMAYLDQQYASPQQSLQLAHALSAIRQESALRFGKGRSFEDQPSDRQQNLIEALRQGQGQADWQTLSPAGFLNQLRSHLVEGYYSHPRVWEAIGFGGRAQFIGYPDYRQWPHSQGQDEG